MTKKTLKKKFKKMQIFITIIFLCMFIIGPFPNHDFTNNNGQETTNNSLNNIPKIQDYTTNSSGNSDWVETTLHQAYNNKSVFEINETSTSFTVPAPNATDFSTSFVNISINNITVSNKTLDIEISSLTYFHDVEVDQCVTSFEVINNCYLREVSFRLREPGTGAGSIDAVVLYNATWDGEKHVPNGNYSISTYDELITDVTVPDGTAGWFFIDFDDFYLDNSKTVDNTWFIGYIDDTGSGKDTNWYYTNDDSDGDSLNETLSYEYDGTNWNLIEDTLHLKNSKVDLNINLSIGLSNPKPSDINLKINNTLVHNNPNLPNNNSGYWDRTGDAGINNQINYTFSADWYNFALEVNNTQVNYTKSMAANTTYTVESGSDVYWESEAIFEAFDHRLNNNTLNYTIPSSWSAYDLKNDSISIAIDKTFLNGSSKIVSVYNTKATDGNWTLYCSSTNLLNDVKIGVGGKETTIAYSNETLEFNATFSKFITGNVNLSVYNNTDKLVFSKLSSVVDTSFVTLNSWVISENLTTYGDHKVQVTWENETDNAIIDSIITIAGETSYYVQNVNETEVLNTINQFNITVEYFDEFNSENITGANVSYDLGGGWQQAYYNSSKEVYTFEVDITSYGNGLKNIPIIMKKTNMMNFTFDYNFYIVTNSTLTEITENCDLNVIKGHNATYDLNYTENDNDKTPILGAIISKETLNSSIIWSFNEPTNGNYLINLNTSQLDVGEYLCNFSITKINFETQIIDFSITVTMAQTQITLINV
ncbi:MAG: hypothetical protein ACTSPA_09320, partial [Promethearchaeota archaeon]